MFAKCYTLLLYQHLTQCMLHLKVIDKVHKFLGQPTYAMFLYPNTRAVHKTDMPVDVFVLLDDVIMKFIMLIFQSVINKFCL